MRERKRRTVKNATRRDRLDFGERLLSTAGLGRVIGMVPSAQDALAQLSLRRERCIHNERVARGVRREDEMEGEVNTDQPVPRSSFTRSRQTTCMCFPQHVGKRTDSARGPVSDLFYLGKRVMCIDSRDGAKMKQVLKHYTTKALIRDGRLYI